MAKNFIHEGKRLVCTAPSGGVVSGALAQVGAAFGVALTSADAGAKFTMAVGGVWTLPKATGALNELVVIYWDATAKNVTATATSNTKIGVVETAAASGDTTVPVRLNDNF